MKLVFVTFHTGLSIRLFHGSGPPKLHLSRTQYVSRRQPPKTQQQDQQSSSSRSKSVFSSGHGKKQRNLPHCSNTFGGKCMYWLQSILCGKFRRSSAPISGLDIETIGTLSTCQLSCVPPSYFEDGGCSGDSMRCLWWQRDPLG